jgi:hypothetical protein
MSRTWNPGVELERKSEPTGLSRWNIAGISGLGRVQKICAEVCPNMRKFIVVGIQLNLDIYQEAA